MGRRIVPDAVEVVDTFGAIDSTDPDFETVDWGDADPEVKTETLELLQRSNPEPTTQILFKWASSLNDPIQYKPQSGTLVPQEVFIAVDVPNKYILHVLYQQGTADIAESCILTLDGYAWVQNTISAKLLKSYTEFKEQ